MAGEREAFGLLVGRHQARLFGAMLRMLGNRLDAEEVTQEAFVRAYAALAAFDPQYRFSAWLYQIAVNLAINYRWKRSREVMVGRDAPEADRYFEGLPDTGPAGRPDALSVEADQRRRLWAAVAALPPDARDMIVLRHVLELSYEEIRQATGLPMGTVKSRLERARGRLAEALRRDGLAGEAAGGRRSW
jgi:RNA polymerase sigma-70 factor (ECF subfamily)